MSPPVKLPSPIREVENQPLPTIASTSYASASGKPIQPDHDMDEDDESLDQDYPSRYYSDEVDSDPEDHDYEPDSRPTSPMSLTQSERGEPDLPDLKECVQEYDTDPKVPPPPVLVQGALALYTEKEIEILRNAYEMIQSRPARWFKEQDAEPPQAAAGRQNDLLDDGSTDDSAVVIDSHEMDEDDGWVNV